MSQLVFISIGSNIFVHTENPVDIHEFGTFVVYSRHAFVDQKSSVHNRGEVGCAMVAEGRCAITFDV